MNTENQVTDESRGTPTRPTHPQEHGSTANRDPMTARRVPTPPSSWHRHADVPAEAMPREMMIHMLTHMMGGGAVARSLDLTRPVTGKSIKGNVTRWWRILFGHGTRTPDELYRREHEVFGNVTISVDMRDALRSGRHMTSTDELKVSALAPGAKLLRLDDSFRLRIERAPARKKPALSADADRILTMHQTSVISRDPHMEFESALWAWANLGGIGGRTRRGLGAVTVTELQEDTPDALAARLASLRNASSESRQHGQETVRSVAVGERMLVRAMQKGSTSKDMLEESAAAMWKFRDFSPIPKAEPPRKGRPIKKLEPPRPSALIIRPIEFRNSGPALCLVPLEGVSDSELDDALRMFDALKRKSGFSMFSLK